MHQATEMSKEHSNPAVDAATAQDQTKETPTCPDLSTTRRHPPHHARSSLESTATTLPPYSQHSARPPSYNDAGIYASCSTPSATTQSQSKPRGQPFSAASLSAVMATSSSSTDKMHSRSGSRKVDDWNEDSTYKSKLASMKGSSTRKWNYFGADIGGNPFKRSSKRN